MWFRKKEKEINLEPNTETESLTFTDIFKSAIHPNCAVCPKCYGVGFESPSIYTDSGVASFNSCSMCAGTGMVNDSKELNMPKAKAEMEKYITALYLDETKTIF
jgi:DnaJ-class molecular chaperone